MIGMHGGAQVQQYHYMNSSFVRSYTEISKAFGGNNYGLTRKIINPIQFGITLSVTQAIRGPDHNTWNTKGTDTHKNTATAAQISFS
jgi:hypothetical protein